MRSSILISHENCEGSISSTLRTRNSMKPLRMLVRNWKHQLLLLCPAKNYEELWEWADLTKTRQNLRVFWKPMNPPECVWGTRNLQITKTILQEKVRIHYSIIIWFTSLFLCLKAMKIPAAKAAVDKEWEKIGENFGVELDESQ